MKADVEQVEKIAKQMWDLLEQRSGGCVDESALREFARLTSEAKMASAYDGYVCEKCGSINSFAKILYSARKHARYGSGVQSGPQKVRDIIFADIYRLKTWEGNDFSQA
jgi:hypothetical protein